MAYLQHIKFVDLRLSGVDKEKSRPAEGMYVFKNGKRYISYRGDKAAVPPYKFIWARYNRLDNFRDMRDWATRFKATPVTLEDPYWPEGVTPTNGQYIEGDAILIKVPILEYARKRKAEIQASETRTDAIKRQFYAELQSMGLPTDQATIDKISEGRLGV